MALPHGTNIAVLMEVNEGDAVVEWLLKLQRPFAQVTSRRCYCWALATAVIDN